jgi:hypothetical protein
MSRSSDGPLGARAGLGGKYMTFRLAGEDYGLDLLKVRELIGFMDITRVPRSPAYLRGVVNLRGKVIPVVDVVSAAATARSEALPRSAQEHKAWSEYLDAIRAWRTQDNEVWRNIDAGGAKAALLELQNQDDFHEVEA